MPYTRRQFVKTVGSATLALKLANTTAFSESGPAKKPNIVFILVDDLGFGDLRSYGAKDMHTPHIDALVSAGIRLSNAYANCPVCSPTSTILITMGGKILLASSGATTESPSLTAAWMVLLDRNQSGDVTSEDFGRK